MTSPEPAPHVLGAGDAVIAFDVGGTDTKSALVDQQGRVVASVSLPTVRDHDAPAEALVRELAARVSRMRAAHPDIPVAAVGVGVPGIVDDEAGIGVFSGNLGWRDAPLRAMLQDALDLPVAFGHDVRNAGAAELLLGAARGARDAMIVTIGTGIAGVIAIDGRVHSAGGYAGEIGHMLVDPAGERCACGAVGCLETISSAAAIARRYTALARHSGAADVSGARDVLHALETGDPIASRVWADAVLALAEQLARVVSLLAPEVIVIGGGLSNAGPALLDPLRDALDSLLSFHRRPALVAAELGGDAGTYGAALAARAVAQHVPAGGSA